MFSRIPALLPPGPCPCSPAEPPAWEGGLPPTCGWQVRSCFQGWEGIWAPLQKQNKSKPEPAFGVKFSQAHKQDVAGSEGGRAAAPPRAPGGEGHPEEWTILLCSWKELLIFLCRAFHLANSSAARWRRRARGIFMEEVHASNSLSSSKLAAPAQKDLGAVNNSVWLRDFHFSGPGWLLPQGCLPHPLRRGAAHPARPPCFTFCSLPASFLSISLFFVCASPLPSPLPSPSLPCSTRSSFLPLPSLSIGSSQARRGQSRCVPGQRMDANLP